MSKAIDVTDYYWVGSQKDYVDEINVYHIHDVVVGRFGGNSNAGAYKNEDGCIVWVNKELDVEFMVLLDAHNTSESAELVIDTIVSLSAEIKTRIRLQPKLAFKSISKLLLTTFESQRFRKACQCIQGETAFLCVVRKGKFLWWFSVGDCILYHAHPELASLNEYQQNHRSFYEWIGRTNTFDLEVPCYSMGTKELRQGKNHLFLTTDGLVECPNTNYSNPIEIFKHFEVSTNDKGVLKLLNDIKENNVRDSTTILSWLVDIEGDGCRPSK
ncbi:protein phosphatase 2C domain-containing protein [Alkalihalobacterium elongatum]|uniref:protein phosphatase 2C domain-containing protein n=1 Tax=Alkalihalobacterium elongatum TaxID=2675466 RepID=UPI001C1F854A|nr:protein phosphatase 2C domain-containing protein [Alkalihalobacterium elongatum]